MRLQRRQVLVRAACAAGVTLGAVLALAQHEAGPQQPWSKYKVHDMQRPDDAATSRHRNTRFRPARVAGT